MSLELPSFERDINGRTYKVYRLHLAKWAELTELLADLLGDPIASLLRGDAVLPDGADPRMSFGDIQGLIAGISKKLSAKTLLKIPKVMGVCLHVDGVPLGSNKQEMWWPRHMKDLAPVIKFFLEVQYSDFYEGLSDSMSDLPSAAPDLSESMSD